MTGCGTTRLRVGGPVLWLAGLAVLIGGAPPVLTRVLAPAPVTPRISVAPARAVPGGSVAVSGVGFPAGATGSLAIEGLSDGLVDYVADEHGNFTARVTLPVATAPGSRMLMALPSPTGMGKNGSTATLASARLDVDPALPVTATPFDRLAALIPDVTTAAGYRYRLHDSDGASMDTLKVISAPDGGYLGVYHATLRGRFTVKLARSSDLLTWRHVVDLDPDASQPTIAALSDGGFLLADEGSRNARTESGTWLRLHHYPSLAALLQARPDRSFEPPHSMVPSDRGAEGTPSIDGVTLNPDLDHSLIRIGFHYFKDAKVDRQASGVLTDFADWVAVADERADDQLMAAGGSGKIGDRDSIELAGASLELVEAQLRNGDSSSWRIFLRQGSSGRVQRLEIRTHRGSAAFANPTLSLVSDPDGGRVLVVTLFLPHSGAARGEAGELIYFKPFDGGP
jgi:hypothetical protein